MDEINEFQYRVPWRAGSCHPGSHHSSQQGGGYEIHSIVPLHVAGDPRRFDVRASMRDPFGQLLVRIFKQRSVIPVSVLADVSASMSFVGQVCKFDLMIDFIASLAYSTYRAGDPFTFTACDSIVRDELSIPVTRAAGVGTLLADRLRQWTAGGANANGLLAGAEQIHGVKSLIFLISDFHLPIDLLRNVLDRLSRHSVVPVVLIDSSEDRIPRTGIARVYDPESDARRTILLRRSLARRLQKKMLGHRKRINDCFADYNLRPMHLIDRFDAESVSRYFCE